MCKQIHLFLVILVSIFIISGTGCSTHSTIPTAVKPAIIYKLHHSAVLSIGNKKIPLRGMIHLMPQERQAKVVMLNDMGMKLLIAEIYVDNEQEIVSKSIFVSPFLQAIPHFYKESVKSIYTIFLEGNDPKIIKQFTLQTNGLKHIGNRDFPEHTILKNTAKNYTLELFLNSGTHSGSE